MIIMINYFMLCALADPGGGANPGPATDVGYAFCMLAETKNIYIIVLFNTWF